MLIKVDDIRKVRQIAKNIDDSRVEIYIREAEELDVIPYIGADFYKKLDNMGDILLDKTEQYLYDGPGEKVSTENELDLPINEYKFLNGGYYDLCGETKQFGGVRKALCYFAYARFVLQHSASVTPFGIVTKAGDESTPVGHGTIVTMASEARKIGQEYLQQTLNFWRHVQESGDYNLGSEKRRKKFIAIG